jgi:hypothetical protein
MSIVKWLILFSCIYSSLYSQIVNPKIWLFGYQTPYTDTNSIDTGFYRTSGLNVLDFRQTTPKLSKNLKGLSMIGCNNLIFDKKDSLIMYSNGSKVFNGKHRLIEGADSLNYGENDWANSPFTGNYYANYNISISPCAITILPSPKGNNQFYLISIFINGDSSRFYKITSSLIDMNLNSGQGKMIQKEKTILLGNFTEALAACKHGNGRDWWIIAREYSNTCYKILLLDSTGVHVKNTNQCNSWDLSAADLNIVSKFSWNGKYFATINSKGVEMYDFNRCSGELSNRREILKATSDTSTNFSICFNKQNNFLYYNSLYKTYQYNINKKTSVKVADYKLFYDTVPYRGDILPVESNFGFSQLGGDNKIYISSTNTAYHLSLIENPDIEGIGCNVHQFSYKLLTNNAGLPNYPNFELGADTCWRSGLEDADIEAITIYPNPVSDILHIESNAKNLVITLFNHIGQRMISQQNTRQLNLRGLATGFYYLEILDSNHQVIKRETIVKR